MTSKELNLKLIELIPDIKYLYSREVSWQEGDDTGSHVVFEDVLCKYVRELLKKNDFEEIKVCFSAIEAILSFHDDYADEVVALSFIDSLSDELDALNSYFGKRLQELISR